MTAFQFRTAFPVSPYPRNTGPFQHGARVHSTHAVVHGSLSNRPVRSRAALPHTQGNNLSIFFSKPRPPRPRLQPEGPVEGEVLWHLAVHCT